jgi:folate-dependent phosphoribosylglycinamide formyltransferase PurN
LAGHGPPQYNIHPANTKKHGGNTMYGLKVHRHVLQSILDKIERGWKKPTDRFFTQITVHEVTAEHDQGQVFLTHEVEIPRNIIERLLKGTLHLGRASEMLQKHVLPKEWKLLPFAVSLAAQKVMEE